MHKALARLVSSNIYLILGILIGMYLASLMTEIPETMCVHEPPTSNATKTPTLAFKKPSTSAPPKKGKLIRPRYYSTELGIKEKLFVGIFTSEDKVNSLAIHVNRTIGHLVDKIKYFMTAQYKLKSKFNLTGLVGFTDTRHKFRPFQVIKYVGDNFAQDYDFYFFANDYTFINAHKLTDSIGKISVSMDVYLGTVVKDGSYCSLDSGIIMSNSVLKAIRTHLDWCVINAISDDHSENIGRCIYHSIGLSCQDSVQGQTLVTFKLKHFEINKHLVELSQRDDFNRAITIYPILQADSMYMLNAYFLRHRLAGIKMEIAMLSADLKEVWPAGARPGAKAATRFDLPRQFYFNMSHMFFPDDFTNVRQHTKADLDDIKNIIDEVKLTILNENGRNLQYRRLINGYRTFDLSRGVDYILDLGFRDLTSGKEVAKRFQICKPLGKVELIPVPYVTENSRITIILPVEEVTIGKSLTFLDRSSELFSRKEKIFIMLVLLYQNASENRGTNDVYVHVKNAATKINQKYRNEDTKLAWVSIRLPIVNTINEQRLTMATYKCLNYAIVDLALKKIGLDSLVLVLDVNCYVTTEFLNRVRMNTIVNYQIFSAIPFRQYNPNVSQLQYFDINKNMGHFDRNEYKFIAFYSRDYVNGSEIT